VEQICERSQHNEGEEEDVDDDDDGEGYGEQDGGARYLVWAFSTHKTEARVSFNGTEKHTVCPQPTSHDDQCEIELIVPVISSSLQVPQKRNLVI
jgi:hypothetical protein